jgi:threonine/homoserine/homoserine lactone efflux protein
MSIETWLAFVAATTILLIMPGPTILAVVSYSLTHGRRANPALVAGVALGDSTALVASLLGLGAVLSASVFWFAVIKVAGGLYLVYLGVRLLRATGSPIAVADSSVDRLPVWRLFINTYLVTALNPKGIIFFVAFVPQFVSNQGNVANQLWILAVTFVVLAALNATAYAVFASRARQLLASRRAQRRFNLFGGLLLTAAGVWAMLARRAS